MLEPLKTPAERAGNTPEALLKKFADNAEVANQIEEAIENAEIPDEVVYVVTGNCAERLYEPFIGTGGGFPRLLRLQMAF